MTQALVNLYTQEKLKEEHYIARLNEIAEPFGYTVGATVVLFIQDNHERRYSTVIFNGTQFVIQTTSGQWKNLEATFFIAQISEGQRLSEHLNEALGHIEEEIYHRYLDEYPNTTQIF